MADEPRIVSEEEIYSGRIVSLKKVEIEMTGGTRVKREIVVHLGSVGMLPMTEDGRFILIRQYRAPTGQRLLEAPAGSLEEGEDPDACAQRELAEEIGQKADSMRKVASFYLAPGWATEFMHGYIATGLSPHVLQGDEDEDIEQVLLTPEETLDAIHRGEIQDCKTIALVGLYFADKYAREKGEV